MKTQSLLLFAILLSGLALYFSPTHDWRSYRFPLEATATATTTRGNDAHPTPTTTPARMPASVVIREAAPVRIQKPTPTQAMPATPATSTPAPPSKPSSATEEHVFDLTNGERTKNSLPAFVWDPRLTMIARAHSADMLAHDYFDHTDLSGCSSSCRADNADYSWRAIGENIYMTEGYRLSSMEEAEMVVEGWMNSPGHRANILNGTFTVSGIGVAEKGDTIYVTAMYARPR